MSWFATIRRWFTEHRRNDRIEHPPLRACYWTGGPAVRHEVHDIAPTGAFILTDDDWLPGTALYVILQHVDGDGQDHEAGKYIGLWAKVVRHAPGGLGLEFLYGSPKERQGLRRFIKEIMRLERAPDTSDTDAPPEQASEAAALEPAAEVPPALLPSAETAPGDGPPAAPPLSAERKAGQALLEFALVIPLLFLLVVNVINFGGFLFSWIAVANAARAGADYMVRGPVMIGNPVAPTDAQIIALVNADMHMLPNSSSVVVSVCKSNVTGCTTPADPEGSIYVLGTVDVTYTYQPFIQLWSFPRLNIRATLPATTIHRKAVARMVQ